MKFINNCIVPFADKMLEFAERLAPLPLLGLRLWIADIFWKSGLTKISNWESTVSLFESEYMVPLLPSNVAAFLSTAIELAVPVMFVLGFGSRLGALALLFMTAMIEFTYQHHEQHIVWALVLLVILFQGPGKLSLDYLIRRHFLK